jgi:multiple sugar transport system substrate-binding protein
MGLRRRGRRVSALRTLRPAWAAAVLALTGACTPWSQPSPATGSAEAGPGPVTIVWMSSPTLRSASDDVRQVLVDAFEQAYPSIKVQLEPGDENTDRMRTVLKGALRKGAATPDVYAGDVIWPAEFGSEGLALPLEKYLPASFWSRFAEPGTPFSSNTLIQAMSYRGSVYAMPYFVDEGFLFYRKDLLARAGLPVPTTWEQLEQDAKILNDMSLPYQYVWQGDEYEGLTCDWIELLADALGGLPDGGDVAAELDSPAALKALRFMRRMIQSGISPLDTNTLEESAADTLFDSGHAAFLRSWDSSYANATSSASQIGSPADVGVAPLPNFAGQSGAGWSAIGGWNLFVNPHSAHISADLTFLTWMSEPQAQRILASQFAEIPSNFSVRTHPPATTVGNPVLAAAALTRLVSRPSATPDYAALSKAIYSHVHAALPGVGSDGADPCRELLAAARSLDPGVRGTLVCPAAAAGGG